jgi:hypothetical protein
MRIRVAGAVLALAVVVAAVPAWAGDLRMWRDAGGHWHFTTEGVPARVESDRLGAGNMERSMSQDQTSDAEQRLRVMVREGREETSLQ